MIPDRLWGLYARRKWELAQRSGYRVYSQDAYETANALDAMRRLSDLAEFWYGLFDVSIERLADALVDGEPPRYAEFRR